MHRYSSAQGNMVGSPCPCGVFHGHNNHCSSSSFLPPPPPAYDVVDYSNSSSVVDCTLSLGTPSTRRTSFSVGDNHHHHHHQPPHDHRRSGGNRLSNFCWDFLQQTTNSSKHHNSSTKSINPSSHRPIPTTTTPAEERRATAAATTNGGGGGGGMMESHMGGYNYGGGWGGHQGQKVQYLSSPAVGNEFRFVDDVVSGESGRDTTDSAGGMQFLSWRLNVTDRPTSQLVYDFTR
ncbi:hypothetical protein V2J09_009767 [Rumex salicifolius]